MEFTTDELLELKEKLSDLLSAYTVDIWHEDVQKLIAIVEMAIADARKGKGK